MKKDLIKKTINKSTDIFTSTYSLMKSFDRLFDDFIFPNLKLKTINEKINSDEKNVYVEVDIPGFSKEEVKINVEDYYLSIEAKKQEKDNTRLANLCYSLPSKVDINNSKATYENGVLRLTLPKIPKTEINTTIKIE